MEKTRKYSTEVNTPIFLHKQGKFGTIEHHRIPQK